MRSQRANRAPYRLYNLLVLALAACLLCALPARAQTKTAGAMAVRVSYVASEGVYIDAGSAAGILPGDTLAVVRAGQTIAHVVVGHTSSRSAASVLLETGTLVKAGDDVLIPANVTARVQTTATLSTPTPPPVQDELTKPKRTRNVFEGDFSSQFYGRKDLTGSDASWIQPGFRTHLKMHNINGWGATFLFRHRTRYYHRSTPHSSGQSTSEWDNRVFEFALVSSARPGGSQWGVGRVLVNDVRGMGYIDGGFFMQNMNSRFRVGVAAGTSPDPVTSKIDFGSKKAGLFAAYELGGTSNRLVLSSALSTEYEGSTVSRDFVYLQAMYTQASRFSFYQSAEVDLNRDWRYAETGKRMSLSNLYSMLTANFGRAVGVDLSYDSRQNYRYSETKNIPDSLFDDDTHRGWRAGLRLSPWTRLFLRADAGIRLHETDSVESRFMTVSARINRFPFSRHSVWMSLSIVEAGLTTGYRPVLSYRFPVARGFFLQTSGGVYMYHSNAITTSNYYVEASTSKSVGTRYFLSGSFRQYLDEQLKSSELYLELGLRI